MQKIQWLVAACAMSLIGGCGGSGGVTSTPTPTPVPTPTPTPATSFPIAGSADFQTIASYRQTGEYPNGRHYLAGASQEKYNPSFTISYDATSKRYALSNPYEEASLGLADYIGKQEGFRVYIKHTGSMTDRLALYSDPTGENPGQAGGTKLTYLNFGVWTHSDTATQLTRDTYQIFGFPTPTAAVPRTGSAFYSATVFGSSIDVREGGARGDLTGSSVLRAFFDTGKVEAEMALLRPNSPVSIGTFYGSGMITQNSFSGEFTDSTAVNFSSGSFTGGFFGPNAEEMGYNYLIRLFPEDPYAGASLRYSDIWMVGTAAGVKLPP